MAKVLKINNNSLELEIELNGETHTIVEPFPEDAFEHEEAIKAADGDSRKIYEETRTFLCKLGLPKDAKVKMSSLLQIIEAISPQKKS